jgi:hypothetical protein
LFRGLLQDTLVKINNVLVGEKKHIRFGDWDAKDVSTHHRVALLADFFPSFDGSSVTSRIKKFVINRPVGNVLVIFDLLDVLPTP